MTEVADSRRAEAEGSVIGQPERLEVADNRRAEVEGSAIGQPERLEVADSRRAEAEGSAIGQPGRPGCVDSRVLDLALIRKQHRRHEWWTPRTKGHVITPARTAFLLDVVCYSSNFSLAVLELSTTKCG